MQMFIRGFAIFAILCSAPAAFGSLVIDNFVTNFATQSQNGVSAALTLSGNVGSPSNTFQRILGTGAQVSAPGGSSSVTMANGANKQFAVTYDLQTMYNFFSTDELTFSYTGTSATLNNYKIEVLVLSSFNGNVTAPGTTVFSQTGLPNGPNTLSVPVGATALSSFRYLQVRVAKDVSDNPDDQTFQFTNLGITSVPEPATMTLLGLTGIAGVIAHRRRRKAQLAA